MNDDTAVQARLALVTGGKVRFEGDVCVGEFGRN